jgi:branched-chain amino acid transport system substrate-binding protein
MNNGISRRRIVGTLSAATAALSAPTWVHAQRASIRVGWAISRTGPFSGGAAATQWPNYLLWIKDVNDAGGLTVEGRKLRIEHIEYDDRSLSEEAVRAVARLIDHDRVDFVLPPWGTGNNLAVMPAFGRAGIPMIAGSMVLNRMPELVRRWPNVFGLLEMPVNYGEAAARVLSRARRAGLISDRVALVHVVEQFGLELVDGARRTLRAENFNIVYDTGYPMGTTDLTPIISAAQRAEPDVFMAYSYPPDTMALVEAARVRGFNPKIFYTAIGTFFPMFKQRFGANAMGVMGIGGWNPDSEPMRAYIRRHVAMHQREPDRWSSSLFYAGLQALGQAIESVGRLDNAAIVNHLRNNSYDTIVGRLAFDETNIYRGGWHVGQWQDGEYFAIAPERPGARRPIIPKPAWTT